MKGGAAAIIGNNENKTHIIMDRNKEFLQNTMNNSIMIKDRSNTNPDIFYIDNKKLQGIAFHNEETKFLTQFLARHKLDVCITHVLHNSDGIDRVQIEFIPMFLNLMPEINNDLNQLRNDYPIIDEKVTTNPNTGQTFIDLTFFSIPFDVLNYSKINLYKRAQNRYGLFDYSSHITIPVFESNDNSSSPKYWRKLDNAPMKWKLDGQIIDGLNNEVHITSITPYLPLDYDKIMTSPSFQNLTHRIFAGGKNKPNNKQKSKKFKKSKKKIRTKAKSKKKRKSKKKKHLLGGAGAEMLPVNSNRTKYDLIQLKSLEEQLGTINFHFLKYLNGIDENNTRIPDTMIIDKIEECLNILDNIFNVPRDNYIHTIKNDTNYNMLMLSIYNGFNEVSKYLIDICVKDGNQNNNPMFTDVANDGNNTMLMAAYRGNKEIFDYLLYTANLDLINVINSNTKHNILHYACELGHGNIIDSTIIFLNKYPDKVSPYLLNQMSSDTYLNYTPLHCAVKQHQLTIIEKMFYLAYNMKHPLLITNQDINGETPIHTAVRYGSHLLIERMLRLFIITTQPKDQSQYDLFNEYMDKIHPHQEYENVLVQNMNLEEIEGIIKEYNKTKSPNELTFLQNMRKIIRDTINLENINLLSAYNLALTFQKQLTARFLLYHGADSDKPIPPGTTPLIPQGGKPLTFISSSAVAAVFDQESIIQMGRDLMHRFKSKI